jgi:hypothetical protein
MRPVPNTTDFLRVLCFPPVLDTSTGVEKIVLAGNVKQLQEIRLNEDLLLEI